jgi:hypothetical protein
MIIAVSGVRNNAPMLAAMPVTWRRERVAMANTLRGEVWLVGRRLKDCPVVVGVDNLAPVNRRATGGRDGRRFERFAEVCQDLASRG